jgi:hypothetical protein
MGHLIHRSKPSLVARIGEKVRNAAEIAGALKGIYDIGRTIYTVGRTVAPYVASAAAVLP